MILSLDISTSITGWSIFSEDGQLVCYGAWITKTKKLKSGTVFGDVFEKAEYIEKELKKLKEDFAFSKIVVEDALVKANRGRSTAHVIALLIKFNSIISWQCYKIFGVQPEYIEARTARKRLGIKIPKECRGKRKTKARKTFLLESALARQPGLVVQWTRNGNPREEMFDIADSIILGMASFDGKNIKKDTRQSKKVGK